MNAFKGVFVAITLCLVLFNLQANGQVPASGSPCTVAMLTSFNPCINYLTNGNGTSGSPTSACCNSLSSLMTNGSSCLCQILTGGVPFRIPLNRTSAISLPKACKQPSIPIQCKAATGAPAPAPGPAGAFTPSASPPTSAQSPSVGSVPSSTTPAVGPVSDTTPSTPEATTPSTPEATVPSTSTGGSSSASPLSASLSASLVLLPIAVIITNFF